MEIEYIRNIILPVLKQHREKRAGIFGSVTSGPATAISDIDILVELGKKITPEYLE